MGMSRAAQTRQWTAVIDALATQVLGDGRDSIAEVDRRFRRLLPGERAIIWEGAAASFEYTYVSPAAVEILGYPIERWLEDQTFWADQLVAGEDRNEALAFCALAALEERDRVFEYRARRADGRTLVIRDIARVIFGAEGVADRLRGIMLDVTSLRSMSVSLRDLRSTWSLRSASPSPP
jgi:PAS domain S-box-containing protein